jgi:hypothetical protein
MPKEKPDFLSGVIFIFLDLQKKRIFNKSAFNEII